MLFQGGNAFVEGVGDVDGVGGLGGPADADHAHAVPRGQPFIQEFGEYPGVAGILGSVESGEGGPPVVGEVEA